MLCEYVDVIDYSLEETKKCCCLPPFVYFHELFSTVNAIYLNTCKKNECLEVSVYLKICFKRSYKTNYDDEV